MKVQVKNILDQSSLNSYLSNSEAAAVSTLRVKNINGFSANDAIQVDKTGNEQSEIRVLGTAAVSGTALTVTAATSYSHPSDTPIYNIKYNQLVFMRSTSGTAGTAVAFTNSTVSITPDSLVTELDDTSGATTYAYKAKYRNSVTTSTSSDSDWLLGTGFSFYSRAKIRERIKDKLFHNGMIKSDDVIDDWINEWLEEMSNSAIKVDRSYGMGTVNVAFGTNGLGTITSDDYKDLKRLWVNYNGNDDYMATKRDTDTIIPDEVFNSTHPYYIWKGDNVFKIEPMDLGGTAKIEYYKMRAILDDDADELPVVMKAYTNSFVNYGVSEAYYSEDSPAKIAKGQTYLTRAKQAKADFINEITPRNYTGFQTIEMTHAVQGDEDEIY